MTYKEDEALLEAGALLVLFSDGVTEAMNEAEEMFEEERLLEVLTQAAAPPTASGVISSVLNAVDAFVGAAEQADDISIVVVGRRPWACAENQE